MQLQVLKQSNRINNIKKLLKDGWIFLLFSFINSFLPIALCFVSALLPNYGAQAVMGIGYAATFQLSFAQLGISFSICLFSLFLSKQINILNDKSGSWIKCLILSIFIGLLSMLVYVVSNYFYFAYSNNRPNTQDTLIYGLNFVYSSIGFVILAPIEGFLLIQLSTKNRLLTGELFLARCFFSILLGYVLMKYTSLNTIGVGLGFTIMSFVFVIINFTIVKKFFHYKFIKKIIKIKMEKGLLKRIMQESIPAISLSAAKGICILILGFLMYDKLTDFVPVSYQMSRVIWFNIMYMIPWFGIGIADAIKFNDLYSNNKRDIKLLIKEFWFLLMISMIVAVLFCIIGYFLVKPLINWYIQNTNLLYGTVPSLGTSLNLVTLPPTSLPEILPGQTFDEYLRYLLFKDKEWSTWFKKNILDIVGNLQHVNEFKTWFINYISATTYDANMIYALIMFKTPEQLEIINSPLLLKFKNSNFNAKTYYYIVIYGVLSSGWSVLLPSIATISKKQMHPILLMVIYFIVIGFIISFGATFSITPVADQLGDNNQFRYLDAWTFPIALTSIIIFCYLISKWSIVCLKSNFIQKNK